jgi:hypothetical protein
MPLQHYPDERTYRLVPHEDRLSRPCDTACMVTPTTSALDAYLDSVRGAPADRGRVELLVRRPAVDQREVLVEAVVDPELGLVGDSWLARGNAAQPDGSPDRAVQLTLINVRVLAAFESDRTRWPLAGDQVYVDFDLSVDRLPAGSQLEIGSALIEVSPQADARTERPVDQGWHDPARR